MDGTIRSDPKWSSEVVLAAVEQGQASKVIVSVPFDSDKFDELMLKSVLANVGVGFVHGQAAEKLNEFGGVAATLYFSGG
ncbi:MAG: hypothetical protein EA381_07740 [Planctomycetaceae bacterium]|nr:MAG: hypothetical protein EA381_07740 [Planctomycetaceae bacterium]